MSRSELHRQIKLRRSWRRQHDNLEVFTEKCKLGHSFRSNYRLHVGGRELMQEANVIQHVPEGGLAVLDFQRNSYRLLASLLSPSNVTKILSTTPMPSF